MKKAVNFGDEQNVIVTDSPVAQIYDAVSKAIDENGGVDSDDTILAFG